MIDVTNLIKEFSVPGLQAFINEYTLGDLGFKTFFPSVFTTNLTFEALQADFGAKVAADVVAFDSRAPRKGRQTPGKITGDIPKIEVARVKKETDLNVYRQLLAAVSGTTNAEARGQAALRLVQWTYEDSRFVLDSVNARMEWMAKQITSTGSYKLTVTNNEAGIVTPVKIDFGIPAGQIANSATDWWAAANVSKPISDIKALDATARAKGLKLGFMIMDKDTFNKIVLSDEVQKYAASFVANALSLQLVPNLNTVNQALANESLPQIRLWDSFINLESKAGVYTAVTGWEPGNVTVTTVPTIGSVQWTTSADAYVSSDVDKSAKALNDFSLVKVFAEQDPITVVTKGIAYATPVLSGANNIYILKTKQS